MSDGSGVIIMDGANVAINNGARVVAGKGTGGARIGKALTVVLVVMFDKMFKYRSPYPVYSSPRVML